MTHRVIGYLRVSTEEQVQSGLGLDAQRAAVTDEVARRRWAITWEVEGGISGAKRNRPALDRALATLAAGDADALVVAKLDRLARSLAHAVDIIALAKQQGWSLVALDLGVDLTTPSGRVLAHTLSAFAEYERELVSARTKAALAQAKARGIRLGRPRQIDPALLVRIVAMNQQGNSFRTIARTLTTEGVPTVRGASTWSPGSIGGFLASAALDPVGVDTTVYPSREAS